MIDANFGNDVARLIRIRDELKKSYGQIPPEKILEIIK